MSEVNGIMIKQRKAPVRRSLEERRAELQQVIDFHLKHVQEAQKRLAALNGAVSINKVVETTRKFLESMTTVQLKAHAQRVGIKGPENYEDLDDLIHDCLVQVGLLDESLSTEAVKVSGGEE